MKMVRKTFFASKQQRILRSLPLKKLTIIAVLFSNLDGLLAEMKEANVQGPLLFV